MVAGEGMILSGKAAEDKNTGRESAFQLHYFPEIPLHPTDNRRVVSAGASNQLRHRFVRDSGGATAPASGAGIVAQVVNPSAKACEDIEAEAYIRGFNKGEKAGFDATVKKIESLQAMLTGAFEELSRLQAKIRHDSEKEIVELALAVAEKVVRKELSSAREAVADVVREAIKKVEHQQDILIRVNPADMQFLDPSRLPSADPSGQSNSIRFRIEADDNISSGGCYIETEGGDVDARLETQLDIIRAAFREKLR